VGGLRLRFELPAFDMQVAFPNLKALRSTGGMPPMNVSNLATFPQTDPLRSSILRAERLHYRLTLPR
jgi:hypothetical protein